MGLSDSELVHALHRRARRALLAGLAALNAASQEGVKSRRAALSAELVHEALSVALLRFVVLLLGRARGLFERERDFTTGRLFAPLDTRVDVRAQLHSGKLIWAFPALLARAETAFHDELVLGLAADGLDFRDCPAELVGNLYELLLGDSVSYAAPRGYELGAGKKRKQTGTFFTPKKLTDVVVGSALEALQRRIGASSHRAHDFVLDFRVCDPAVGGGAFLLEVARALSSHPSASSAVERRRFLATRVVHGVDINPIAVAVAEAALCLFVEDPSLSLADAGRNLRVGDALVGAPYAAHVSSSLRPGGSAPGVDFWAQFPEVYERGGFDLVIGNPPWVAYAGRAAQPLEPARRAYLAAHYSTLKGYPTLHGLFVERALRLAPQGTVALVVPSPIADLQGYRAVRRMVRATHSPREPMLEFGQDAFESVTQPCFALIAEASTGSRPPLEVKDAPFRLAERQRAGAVAVEIMPPAALVEIAKLPSFPRELFGEMGFQTTSIVTQTLLTRAPVPDQNQYYPLLEGRDVKAFAEGEPRLFLRPDRDALVRARCRLRAREDYQRVLFVIRQTARYPIAALHRGEPFRNSLLAGFAVDGLPAELVVGLLNSSLYRASHVASQRDARQAAFPQVKIAHLRALPLPPLDDAARTRIATLTTELSLAGLDATAQERLDTAVFGLFSLGVAASRDVLEFLAARSTKRR